MQKKFGKTAARPNAVALRFGMYAAPHRIAPTPPAAFGHYQLVAPKDWDVLGNDRHSNCIYAGAAHETRMWNYEAKQPTYFSTSNVLKDYSAVTGFLPGRPETDNGGDMVEAAEYRRKTGVLDGHGNRHKIAAFVALNAGDVDQVAVAAWQFGAVGVGFMLPEYATELTDQGKPWDVISPAEGRDGHYVPIVGRKANGNFVVVTWGLVQEVTPKFVRVFMDEGLAYLSEERLTSGCSLEGFDLAGLRADLEAFG